MIYEIGRCLIVKNMTSIGHIGIIIYNHLNNSYLYGITILKVVKNDKLCSVTNNYNSII